MLTRPSGLRCSCRHHRVARLPIGAAAIPGRSILQLDLIALAQAIRAGTLWHRTWMGCSRCGSSFLSSAAIDIDGDLVRLAGELVRRIAGDGEIEPHADGQQKIAVLQREVGSARGHRAGTADIERLIAGNQIGRAPGGGNGNVRAACAVGEILPSAWARRIPLPAKSSGRSRG